MEFTNEKLAVLNQLKLETDPIGLKQLLLKLGPSYKDRSVRRWLSEMIADGLIEKTGLKKGTLYRVLKTVHLDTGSKCFSQKSLAAIALVRRPIYERPPVAYNEEWLDAYIPNKTHYLPLLIKKQLHKEGDRAKNEDPAGTYAHQIFSRLLIDLSYNSSRLEGNTYSLLDTQRLLLEGKDAQGKLDEEKVMILNHKEAIRYLVEQAPSINISTQTFFTLHYLLSDGLVESSQAGKIRDQGVRIGGSTYIPFENPHTLKQILEKIAGKAALIQNPYEQSFFLLVHITYLQPFIDVNKRTARLSANIPLVKHNLVPLSFNDIEREDYTSAVLAIYELQNIQPLMDIFAFSYTRTCAVYDSTVKALGFDEVRVRYRTQRRLLLSEILIKKLHGNPLSTHIKKEAKNLIPIKDQKAFIEDIYEDLDQMDESRLVGLGVTPLEFKRWHALFKKGA